AVEAACLPTAYLTAYRMLFSKARLRPGATVLIQGAGGGLSTAAETLALAAGLRVFVSSRSEQKRQAAAARGVHHVIAAGREAASEVLSLTGGEGVTRSLNRWASPPGPPACASFGEVAPSWSLELPLEPTHPLTCAESSGGSCRCWGRRWAPDLSSER
ncbi:Alcohol dehydrogenase, zinc-binding domain protein, partial [mine drainage metagenome]